MYVHAYAHSLGHNLNITAECSVLQYCIAPAQGVVFVIMTAGVVYLVCYRQFEGIVLAWMFFFLGGTQV